MKVTGRAIPVGGNTGRVRNCKRGLFGIDGRPSRYPGVRVKSRGLGWAGDDRCAITFPRRWGLAVIVYDRSGEAF